MDAFLGRINLVVEGQELPGQAFQACPRQRRQPGIVRIGNNAEQILDLRHANRSNDAELGHVGDGFAHCERDRRALGT